MRTANPIPSSNGSAAPWGKARAWFGMVTTVALLAWSIGISAPAAEEISDRSGNHFGIGLYRDGQLVETLQQFNVADFTDAPTSKRVGLQREGVEARPRPAAPRLSETAQRRNAELMQAAESGIRLQRHIRAAAQGDVLSRLSQDAEFLRLAGDFRNGQMRVREAMLEIRADLQARGLPQVILERQETALRRHDERMMEFEKALADTTNEGAAAGDQLQTLLQQTVFVREPALPSEPTVQVHRVEAPRLTLAEADALVEDAENAPRPEAGTRASRQSARGQMAPTKRVETRSFIQGDAPAAGDLAATPEVQFTQAIIDKAATLGSSPQRIYDFVRNSVGYQPYLGSRKGASFTLQQLNGNDTDQASLLIALLRVAGIPARYARGTVEMTPEQAMALTGVDDPHTAASILTTAGLNGVAIVNGPEVIAVRSTRVWVLAYVPYSNYRGAGPEDTGKAWIPLDPSFKAWSITPGQDVLGAMAWNADEFLGAHISTFHSLSPIEQLEADIQAWLNANQPGTTVADIERRRAVGSLDLGLLPASLPYPIVSVNSTFAELEDSMRYKVRFHLHDQGATFLNHTIRLSDLAGHRLTIGYVGATPADQAVIDSYGSIYETPPSGVEVKPVLMLDGVSIATGAGSIGLGMTHDSDMHFTAPTGASNQQPTVENSMTAGNGQAIAFDTFLDEGGDALGFGSFGSGPAVEGLLHPTAVEYLNRVDVGMERAARWMRMVSIQDVSEAIVESSVQVTYSIFGAPLSFEWTGMIVDADRRVVGPFAVDGDDTKSVPYMKLTGYDGSNMENRLFEDLYGQDAVSTIKILQLASDAGVGLCTITTSIAAQCPGLSHSASTIGAINQALAQGHHVTIPKAPITVGLWSGTGYIDMTPGTGAAGYIISGGISGQVVVSGGATVQTWPITLSCAPLPNTLKAEVTSPSQDSPNTAAVFCPDNSHVSFTLKLKYDCKNRPGQQMTVARSTTKTVKQIVETFGAGDYTISVSGAPVDSPRHPRKITLLAVKEIEVASAKATGGPQVFEGHKPWPFDPKKNPDPGKHLVVFFKDTIDSSLKVQDFDVTMEAKVPSSLVNATHTSEVWRKQSGPSSGSLDKTDTYSVKLRNPKEGGVYKMEFELGTPCASVPKSEVNIVLPLAGGEIKDIVAADLRRADAFAVLVLASYNVLERNLPSNGLRWFNNGGAGDYLGRPDAAATPTVWLYNQVDGNGFGAVATWFGVPVRTAKVSNFMVAYASRKIGVTSVAAWLSQVIGSWNDGAASRSWDAGWSIAGGADYKTTATAMVKDIFARADIKNQKLWPNPNPCTTHVLRSVWFDPDRQFSSPGFLEMTSP